MKIKVWQFEYEFDRQDAEIVIPLALLILAMTLTPLNRIWLLAGASCYYLSYFFLKKLF